MLDKGQMSTAQFELEGQLDQENAPSPFVCTTCIKYGTLNRKSLQQLNHSKKIKKSHGNPYCQFRSYQYKGWIPTHKLRPLPAISLESILALLVELASSISCVRGI